MASGIIRNYLNIMNTYTQSVATIVCNIGNCLVTQILSQSQVGNSMYWAMRTWWRWSTEFESERQNREERGWKWVMGWSECVTLLICWSAATFTTSQPLLGCTVNGPKNRKHPACGSCVNTNHLQRWKTGSVHTHTHTLGTFIRYPVLEESGPWVHLLETVRFRWPAWVRLTEVSPAAEHTQRPSTSHHIQTQALAPALMSACFMEVKSIAQAVV